MVVFLRMVQVLVCLFLLMGMVIFMLVIVFANSTLFQESIELFIGNCRLKIEILNGFVTHWYPWFFRGTYFDHGIESGVFAFDNAYGSFHANVSFRVLSYTKIKKD